VLKSTLNVTVIILVYEIQKTETFQKFGIRIIFSGMKRERGAEI
jgi:hypothetical protein